MHLIEPLGFSMEHAQLRRAGLDYHEFATVETHPGWAAYLEQSAGSRRFAFSTRGATGYSEVRYLPGDHLLFGPETRGLPADIRESNEVHALLRLPMRPGSRSLNLSNTVAVCVYEAWRQAGFA